MQITQEQHEENLAIIEATPDDSATHVEVGDQIDFMRLCDDTGLWSYYGHEWRELNHPNLNYFNSIRAISDIKLQIAMYERIQELEKAEKKAFWWSAEFTNTVHDNNINSAWNDYKANIKN